MQRGTLGARQAEPAEPHAGEVDRADGAAGVERVVDRQAAPLVAPLVRELEAGAHGSHDDADGARRPRDDLEHGLVRRRVGLGRDGDERVVGTRVTRRQVRRARGLDLVRGRRETGDANPHGRTGRAGRNLELAGSVLGGNLEGAVELVVAAVAAARDEERPRLLVRRQQLGQAVPVAEAAPEQAAKVERRPGATSSSRSQASARTPSSSRRAPRSGAGPSRSCPRERPLVEVRRPALVERRAGRAPEQRVGAAAAARSATRAGPRRRHPVRRAAPLRARRARTARRACSGRARR